MSKMLQNPRTPVDVSKPPAPVKVRLRRVNCNQAIPYPPDGQAREWWQRLRKALGTSSSAFVQASLFQLIAAARLPNSGISEIAVNASLAFIEGVKPQGEVEAALVIQMACTHAAAMAVLSRVAGLHGTDRNAPARVSAAAKLLRAYAAQVETWRRLKTAALNYSVLSTSISMRAAKRLIGNVLRGSSLRQHVLDLWGKEEFLTSVLEPPMFCNAQLYFAMQHGVFGCVIPERF